MVQEASSAQMENHTNFRQLARFVQNEIDICKVIDSYTLVQ